VWRSMPNATLSIAKNSTVRFKLKVSQDGNVLTPPSTIANGATPNNMLSIAREADAGGRAVFTITALNEGSASAEFGSGPGKLVVSATVTAPAPGPVVFEIDGAFEIV